MVNKILITLIIINYVYFNSITESSIDIYEKYNLSYLYKPVIFIENNLIIINSNNYKYLINLNTNELLVKINKAYKYSKAKDILLLYFITSDYRLLFNFYNLRTKTNDYFYLKKYYFFAKNKVIKISLKCINNVYFIIVKYLNNKKIYLKIFKVYFNSNNRTKYLLIFKKKYTYYNKNININIIPHNSIFLFLVINYNKYYLYKFINEYYPTSLIYKNKLKINHKSIKNIYFKYNFLIIKYNDYYEIIDIKIKDISNNNNNIEIYFKNIYKKYNLNIKQYTIIKFKYYYYIITIDSKNNTKYYIYYDKLYLLLIYENITNDITKYNYKLKNIHYIISNNQLQLLKFSENNISILNIILDIDNNILQKIISKISSNKLSINNNDNCETKTNINCILNFNTCSYIINNYICMQSNNKNKYITDLNMYNIENMLNIITNNYNDNIENINYIYLNNTNSSIYNLKAFNNKNIKLLNDSFVNIINFNLSNNYKTIYFTFYNNSTINDYYLKYNTLPIIYIYNTYKNKLNLDILQIQNYLDLSKVIFRISSINNLKLIIFFNNITANTDDIYIKIDIIESENISFYYLYDYLYLFGLFFLAYNIIFLFIMCLKCIINLRNYIHNRNHTNIFQELILKMKRFKYKYYTKKDYFKYNILEPIKYNINNLKIKQNNCIICLSTFENNENIIKTQCDHIFHYDCLINWKNTDSQSNNNKCPVCLHIIF